MGPGPRAPGVGSVRAARIYTPGPVLGGAQRETHLPKGLMGCMSGALQYS